MTIPAFDHNGVLPPHRGDPRRRAELSPYPVTSLQVVERFFTSPEREAILRGWLALRTQLVADGMTDGFQWLDGSFMEDIERRETRPPGDIDVVTFYRPAPAFHIQFAALVALPAWADRDAAKQTYHVDHFLVDLTVAGEVLVDHTRYWSGLFSHTRDAVWKGMLRVQLQTPADDQAALDRLNGQAP